MKRAKIGNWEILEVLQDRRVVVICTGCYIHTKVAHVADLKEKPKSVCRKCYAKRTKEARTKWAFPNRKSASTCTSNEGV